MNFNDTLVSTANAARNAANNIDLFTSLEHTRNLKVIRSLLGPTLRGVILQVGKQQDTLSVPASHSAHFDWKYSHDDPTMRQLAAKARAKQWNPDTDLDFGIDLDPLDPERPLMRRETLPITELSQFRTLTERQKRIQGHAFTAFMLSQFLHGEQGALLAACQITEAVEWTDAKLYGATQVMDEGRHVDVFDRYLTKIEKRYDINDNLFVVIDALMRDGRWDMKFLGMQILVEGLALGAFGTLRASTDEPLLKKMLSYVIADEARHVHFGVVALERLYSNGMSDSERREREDWCYEMCLMLRNRFLAHEFYDEFWGHAMTRKAWDKTISASPLMTHFRNSMFRRIIPNLKRIHLLSDRMRPHYESLGILQFENEPAADEHDHDE